MMGQVALGKVLFPSVLAVGRPGPICSGSMGSNSPASGVCVSQVDFLKFKPFIVGKQVPSLEMSFFFLEIFARPLKRAPSTGAAP